ncbi:MAG: class I SAM-dependent methyltransferase [Phycisphaerae bacterium]
MPIDIRAEAARYYDLNPQAPDDIPFYRERIPSPDSAVLELGCGTGRVLVPLATDCAYIHGVDASGAMISICREKLAGAGIPVTKARVEVGDITEIDLGRTFDLITAPYRVFQNLEADSEVDGLFEVVRRHLAPGGTCILNVFQPNRDAEGLRREWANQAEFTAWELPSESGRITCHVRKARIDADRMVLYPEIIYRTYRGDELTEEAALRIAMRCYYHHEFEQVVLEHGFAILGRWGGYSGERYGEGPELVIQFTAAKPP